jgi:DNA polymerase III delta subunit
MLLRLTKEREIKLDASVKDMILKHCGQDSAKLASLIDRIANIYGPGSTLSANDVEPYLGEAGNVAIYELANEICAGHQSAALDIVIRMLNTTSSENAKPMHPLQIVSLLANHFRKLATLDDPAIRNQNDAHAALDKKGNPYGAKKSWELSRRLGSYTIASCINVLSSADVSLKGANALEGNVIIELLVISLCQMCDASETTITHISREFSDALFV